ncbi:SH3 domain-containing protein [Algicella marina]|uniref:SH3 domain-containing protein n=1 Tax=Algicella marina TaxID=2683284 RepID=A0A6P1SW20_9RHOB|nr:SH3 domain-containing protein [Algicella marina]QHQ34648.1 hypothetical protein GO499_05305 [Algicella marina]
MHYTVTRGWTATYSAPIEVRVGEKLVLSGKEDEWDGHRWLWARSEAGGEGWVPDSLPVSSEGTTVARETYSAMELTCIPGELVTGLRQTHGWILCRRETGQVGWVPRSCLAKYQEELVREVF